MRAELFRVENLSKSFDGARAVDGVSFSVRSGSITALIGPNGSGKSTTIDCVSGFVRPDAGRIEFDGRDMTGAPPHVLARAGLVRTFQNVRVYERLSLLENLLVAVQEFQGVGTLRTILGGKQAKSAEEQGLNRARELLQLVGLPHYAEAPAAILSYGQRKLLSLAMALMPRPALVILDEPLAGVNPSVVREIAKLVTGLNAAGQTFLIVEHNIPFVMQVSDRVVVLEAGRKLVEGAPGDVRSDERVLAAYLGRRARESKPVEASQ